MTKKIIILLLMIFTTNKTSYAACDGLSGLYEQRVKLIRQYSIDIGNDYVGKKERADKIQKQISEIDLKYRKMIYDMFYEADKGGNKLINECCNLTKEDRYLFFVCKLITYNRFKNAELFIRDLPSSRTDFHPLWEIDGITAGPFGYPTPHPALFDKASFVNIFIDTVYQLAANDYATAIDKFLQLNKYADGEYGEYMASKMLNFFENYPTVVIKNWEIIKKDSSTINFASTDYKIKINSIVNNYQNPCKKLAVDSLICNEIIDFLKKQ